MQIPKFEKEWIKWIVGGVTIPLLVALIPFILKACDPQPPEFTIVNNILRPDSTITIEARNDAANRKIDLDVEFDGLLFAREGKAIPGTTPQRWRFSLVKLHTGPDSLLRDGSHQLRISFRGGKLSSPLTVIFITQAPKVAVEIRSQKDNPDLRIIEGVASSEPQDSSQRITVEVVFNHHGTPSKTEIPVKSIRDAQGRVYFEFETKIKGLPDIPPDDPRYEQDWEH